jgi:hypothetical protein
VITAWWLFVAPKARLDVPRPARFAGELAVWAAAALALAVATEPAYGIAFGIVTVLSGVVNYASE